VIEPLWVCAAKVEPGDSGADSRTVLWYFARMLQPAKNNAAKSRHPIDILVK